MIVGLLRPLRVSPSHLRSCLNESFHSISISNRNTQVTSHAVFVLCCRFQFTVFTSNFTVARKCCMASPTPDWREPIGELVQTPRLRNSFYYHTGWLTHSHTCASTLSYFNRFVWNRKEHSIEVHNSRRPLDRLALTQTP